MVLFFPGLPTNPFHRPIPGRCHWGYPVFFCITETIKPVWFSDFNSILGFHVKPIPIHGKFTAGRPPKPASSVVFAIRIPPNHQRSCTIRYVSSRPNLSFMIPLLFTIITQLGPQGLYLRSGLFRAFDTPCQQINSTTVGGFKPESLPLRGPCTLLGTYPGRIGLTGH